MLRIHVAGVAAYQPAVIVTSPLARQQQPHMLPGRVQQARMLNNASPGQMLLLTEGMHLCCRRTCARCSAQVQEEAEGCGQPAGSTGRGRGG
jgi:hypothetical protein